MRIAHSFLPIAWFIPVDVYTRKCLTTFCKFLNPFQVFYIYQLRTVNQCVLLGLEIATDAVAFARPIKQILFVKWTIHYRGIIICHCCCLINYISFSVFLNVLNGLIFPLTSRIERKYCLISISYNGRVIWHFHISEYLTELEWFHKPRFLYVNVQER